MNDAYPPIALFGAAPDTGNQGVTALCQSVVAGLWRRGFRDVTVFDNGRGVRREPEPIGDMSFELRRQGATYGKRYYRGENLTLARVMCRARIPGNPIARTIKRAGAVLDISGGDSFSDIYGPRRFASIVSAKLLALEAGRPLYLLPQTYGPYESPQAKKTATEILRRASMALARDRRSHEVMRELLANDFRPARHRCGVDVAFALPECKPPNALVDRFFSWKERQGRALGLNVSGLLYNEPSLAQARFGLGVDYRSLMLATARRLFGETNAGVLILPHVHDRPGSRESDQDAARALVAQMPVGWRERAFLVEEPVSAGEAKWLIKHTDWFCGARMHATIAALSSGVPAIALAYSDKMHGVFDSCGQGDCVIDLRERLPLRWFVEAIMRSIGEANGARDRLRAAIPAVIALANRQLDELTLDLIKGPGKPSATHGWGAR
jgi:polysaccharide pyruvyl transferase WcaK-like protein